MTKKKKKKKNDQIPFPRSNPSPHPTLVRISPRHTPLSPRPSPSPLAPRPSSIPLDTLSPSPPISLNTLSSSSTPISLSDSVPTHGISEVSSCCDLVLIARIWYYLRPQHRERDRLCFALIGRFRLSGGRGEHFLCDPGRSDFLFSALDQELGGDEFDEENYKQKLICSRKRSLPLLNATSAYTFNSECNKRPFYSFYPERKF